MSEISSLPNLLVRCGVGRRFMNAELPQFSRELKKLAATEDSLFVTGPKGTGKTHFLCACMRNFLEKNLNSGQIAVESIITGRKQLLRFLPVPELMLQFKQSYRQDAKLSEADILDLYSYMDLLVIDDLGAERVSDWSIQMLYLLIDRRSRDLKPTMISSNLKLPEIATKLDDRIASRIAEMCREVRFKGKDRRLATRAA